MENDPKPAASRLRATTMANTTLLIAERAWSNRFPPSFPSSSLDALIISVLLSLGVFRGGGARGPVDRCVWGGRRSVGRDVSQDVVRQVRGDRHGRGGRR